MNESALTRVDGRERLLDLVERSLPSARSRRVYRSRLIAFLDWHAGQGSPALSKHLLNTYRDELAAAGQSSSSVNGAMTAIRKMISEAADNGLMPHDEAERVKSAKGMPHRGQRLGNWFTREQAQALIKAPDIGTRAGLRDRALLAVLIGAGLRREEAAGLTVDHIAQREGRWVLVDIVGKGSKVRSVPIAAWVYVAVREWLDEAGITAGPVFRAVNRGDNVQNGGMTPQAIYYRVKRYAPGYAPHDARRSYAKLSRTAGAPIEQIQLTLGHASIATTERYLGTDLDLSRAPSDVLELTL